MALDPLHDNRPLPLQLLLIPFPPLLLAVLQPRTLVVLQHPMLLAKLPVAEATISYDTLCYLMAVLERAFVLLGRAAAERQRYMEGGVGRYGEGG